MRATPEQTGGLIARGEEAFGQGATKASDQLFDISQFKDKINADDQVNYYITTHDKILYGDPDKSTPGPDGKPVPDTGFYGLQGRAASDARAAVLKQLEDARLEGRANLKSPQAQLEYDQQTRRMYADSVQRTGLHADQQWKGWAGNVNEAGAGHSLNGFLRNLDNAEAMSNYARDYISFKVQAAQAKIGDDPAIKQRVEDEARRELLKAQVQYIGANDPLKAIGILDKPENRAIAGTEYEQLRLQLAARADAQTGNNIAQKYRPAAFQGAVGTAIARAAAVSGMPEGFLTTTASIESGGDPASRTGSYKGLFNLSDEEFNKYGGGNIYDPFDNAMAAAKKLKAEATAFQQQYGREPTAGDIYLIHNQGAAGYAAHLANPAAPAWQNMASTAEGRQKGEAWAKAAIWGNVPDKYKAIFGNVNQVTSAQFVAMWQARANEGQFSSAGIASMKGTAYQMAMADPEFRAATPQAQQHALQRISQDFTAAQIAEDQNIKQRREANDQAANGYVARILKGDTRGVVEQIADDPNLDHQTRLALGRAAEKSADESVEAASNSYGKGFWGAYKGIVAPSGDEAKINDVGQLLSRAGPDGDLTLAGVAKLSQVLSASRKSVDDNAVHSAKLGLMTYAKSKLSFDQEMLFPGLKPMSDPKGAQIFNAQFIPKFEAAYDAWIKQGKNPWEFLTQDNIDKLMSGMRSHAEMAMDRIGAGAEVTGEKADQAIPPPLPGIPAPLWQSLMTVRPIMSDGHPVAPGNWAEAIRRLKENPSATVTEAFDRHFKTEDQFAAAAILAKLGQEAKEKPPAPSVPPEQQAAQASGRELHVTPEPPPPRPLGEPGLGIRAVRSLMEGKKKDETPEFGVQRPNYIKPVAPP